MLWKVKHSRFYPKAGRLPLKEHHMVIARSVLKPKEISYFVSNASPETKVDNRLLAGFSSWHVERCI